MYRLATTRELNCLLRSLENEPVEDEQVPQSSSSRHTENTGTESYKQVLETEGHAALERDTPSPTDLSGQFSHDDIVDFAEKEHLWDQIVQILSPRCTRYLSVSLADDDLMKELESITSVPAEVAQLQDRHLGCSEDFDKFVGDMTTGMITLYERDFVQLHHGKRGLPFVERPGISFLLCGISLAQLYESIDASTKHGLDRVTLHCLKILSCPSAWVQALEAFGPAPKPAQTRVTRVQTMSPTSREQMRKIAMHATRSSRRPSGVRMKTTDISLDECPHCHRPTDTKPTIVECECGAVIIRYAQCEGSGRRKMRRKPRGLAKLRERPSAGGRNRASSI